MSKVFRQTEDGSLELVPMATTDLTPSQVEASMRFWVSVAEPSSLLVLRRQDVEALLQRLDSPQNAPGADFGPPSGPLGLVGPDGHLKRSERA